MTHDLSSNLKQKMCFFQNWTVFRATKAISTQAPSSSHQKLGSLSARLIAGNELPPIPANSQGCSWNSQACAIKLKCGGPENFQRSEIYPKMTPSLKPEKGIFPRPSIFLGYLGIYQHGNGHISHLLNRRYIFNCVGIFHCHSFVFSGCVYLS